MTTVQQAIDRAINDYLLTGSRPQRNVLTGAVSDSDTTLAVTHDLGGIAAGAKLAMGLEDMHVVSVDPTAGSATVIRGDYGTVAAAHDAGTIVYVNPKFTQATVLRAINDELDSLSGEGLFRMTAMDVTYNSSVRGYDMDGVDPDQLLGVFEVRASTSGPWQDWPRIQSYELARHMPSADFPSTVSIILHDYVEAGQIVRVRYMTPYANVDALDQELTEDAGLHSQAHDIVSIGAAARLVAGREIKRNFTEAQGDTRRAAEVPPGATLQSVTGLLKLREERIEAERMRLTRLYPPRMFV